MCRYRTLASTGYIIANSPMAIGSETVPTLTVSSSWFSPGRDLPSAMPVAIANPIQTGRYRSRVERPAVTVEPGGVEVVVTGASASTLRRRTRSTASGDVGFLADDYCLQAATGAGAQHLGGLPLGDWTLGPS